MRRDPLSGVAVGTDKKPPPVGVVVHLGLQEYYDGSVDHLKTAIQESPGNREIARRKFLLLYDSVPGGTGYLANLLRTKGNLMQVLKEALEVVQNCSCIEEEGRDGCYRCLYAYRNHYDMPHTSRSAAQELLEDLVARRGELVEIDTVDDISVHGVLESELEARFLQRLRDLEVEPSRLEKTTVRGRPGYVLEIGGYAYDIEPQVKVGPEEGVARTCSVDFVIRPRDSEMRPIAVFLDGLQYHRNRIGRDLVQRRALRASGQYTVWSLSWRDVTKESAEDARNFLEPATDRYVKLLAAMGESRSQKARQIVDQGSFEWLIDLLETRDEALFERVALAEGLLFARRQSDPDAWRAAAEARLPTPVASLLEERADEEGALLGLRDGPTDRDPVTLWATISPSAAQALSTNVDLARRGLTVALHLNDRRGEREEDFEADWNGFLRLYNLFQFIPDAYPVTADEEAFQGYEELIGSSTAERLHDHVPADSALNQFDEAEWEQTFANAEYSPDEVTAVLERLYDAEIPAPAVPFELQSGGQIVGTAELGWPGPDVAVLLPDQESYRGAFEDNEWTVYSVSEVTGRPEELVDALLGES